MTLCAPSSSVFGKSFPVVEVKVESFQILLELVFEPQEGATYFPRGVWKLTVHQFLRDSVVIHPHNVTDPAQLILHQKGFDASDVALL